MSRKFVKILVGLALFGGGINLPGDSEPPGLSLANPTVEDEVFTVSFYTQTNRTYVLEFKPGLDTTLWTTVAALAGNDATQQISGPIASPQGFYRVISTPSTPDSFHAGEVIVSTDAEQHHWENRLYRSARAMAVRIQPGFNIRQIVQDIITADPAWKEAQTLLTRTNYALLGLSAIAPSLGLEALNLSLTKAALVPGVTVVDPVFVDLQSGLFFASSDQLIIGLKPGVDPQVFFGSDWTRVRPLAGTTNQFIMQGTNAPATTICRLASELSFYSMVQWAEPNFLCQVVPLTQEPNDPLFTHQWHLENTGQSGGLGGADVDALQAWGLAKGAGVTIAILDDGFEYDHPDLQANLYVNPGEIPDNGLDDDSNGYVDDFRGWDFGSAWPFFGVLVPEPEDNDPSPGEADNHGTSVAGVACARGFNELGIIGAAPESRFLPLRLLIAGEAQNHFLATDRFASALYYAAGRNADGQQTWPGAQILNLSFALANPYPTGTGMAAIDEALTWAGTAGRAGKGCILMTAAGNNNDAQVSYPASHPQAIAVGASTDRDVRAGYSNRGNRLDFVAPSSPWSLTNQVGAYIITTDRQGNKGYNASPGTAGDFNAYFGGTSSASALASGVAALMLAANPGLTADEVRQKLRDTAEKVGGVQYDAQGFNPDYGYGRINAYRAVAQVSLQPGEFQFSLGNYFVDENDGMVIIAVQRIHGRHGPVSVSYATSNGTATAGLDYSATAGTLDWVDGETTDKTFTVSILDDSIYEGNETITLTLDHPTGNAGLTDLSTATLTIIEEDPPVNHPPSLNPIGNKIISEGNLLSFTASATDGDLPVQTLTFSLDAGAPDGAILTPEGVFSWTPTEAQGPSTNLVTIRVSDGALEDTETFEIVVNEMNVAPILAAIGNKTVPEGSLLSLNASATDADLPVQTLTFSLDAGAPDGASLTPEGVFSWTPTETQGPSTNLVTIRVSDGALEDTETFEIVVNEMNVAPILAAIGNKTVPEGSLLSLNASATDADLPVQTLTFSLDMGAPDGASLTPEGVFSWTPTEAQGPSTNLVTIRVSDGALEDTETFEIVVNEVNVAPILAAIGNQTVPEGSLLSLTASANDADLPVQTLTFSLDAGAPDGASLTPEGVFSWTPTEAQGPSTNLVTIRVSDGEFEDTETFEIVVNEVNVAPVLAAIGNQTVPEGNLLSFTASATDADLPVQTLTFSLDAGAPDGASLTPEGVFSWTPTEAQGPSTNLVTIRVSDGVLEDTETFEIMVYSQSGWDLSLGGSGPDTLTAMITTADGGFLLAGNSSSPLSGDKTEPVIGGDSDFWLVRFDAAGNKIWDRTLGGTGSDDLQSVIQTPNGGFVVTGRSDSSPSGTKTSPNYGGFDGWLVKLDANGAPAWDHTYGGSDEDGINQVRVTTDGGLVVAGYSASGADGNKTNSNYGLLDYWVLRLDANGNKLWEQVYGGHDQDQLTDLLLLADNGIILAGQSKSTPSGNKTGSSYGNFDCWIVRLDTNGNKLWDNTYGGDQDDIPAQIQVLPDGGLLIAGYSNSEVSGNKTSPHYGDHDFWLVKLDPSGNKLWDRSFGGSENDKASGVLSLADGSLLLAGTSNSGISGSKQSAGYGSNDVWLVRVDAHGGYLMEQTLGGNADDRVNALTLALDGKVVLGGSSKSAISGTKLSPNQGEWDFWFLKTTALVTLLPKGMVHIPFGTFILGSPNDEVGRSPDEGPQTEVFISRGFWMSQGETTQKEYLAVTGQNPSFFTGELDLPVESVSWADANIFCALLTDQERAAGRLPEGYVYRLPTEAEWEYACRAGTTTRFSFGDDPAYSQLEDYAWTGANSGGQTHPGGLKLPNPWNLYDLYGNVKEWCLDWYGTYPGGTLTDPTGPVTGSNRVLRGGAIFTQRIFYKTYRSAFRYYTWPTYQGNDVGFRPVLAPAQP